MSTQIDERVVSMKFDNKNFEKNVATSMSTIDKLKQKLNFKNAGKSLDELSSSAQNVSFSKMADSLSTLEKRFSTMGIVGMTVIQNLTNSAMSFVKQITNFVTSGIKTGGINRAMKIENARFQLGILLNDSEKVAAVMSNVSAAVDGTAYGLDAAATIASQLVASGMEAGEEMQHSLQAISGVAALTNSSYEDIGRIFTQISGQGRVMGDDLLQLSTRGMNAAATLAEAFGKTEAEVRDMVSKGEVSFQTFSDVMYNAYSEGAKKANESLTGAFSNVKSALARIGADFVSPLVVQNGPIVKFLNAVREKINDIRKVTTPIAETLSGTIGKWIEKIADVFSKIDVAGKIAKLKSIFENTKFKAVADRIQQVTTATKAVTQATQDFSEVVDKVINGDFGNAPERWQKLTEAGYDWAHIQNLVNEKLGSSVRHATDYQEIQNEVVETQAVTIDQLTKMSDAELKNIGFTEDEIAAFKELEQQSEKTGIPIQELMENVDQLSGKFLILDSFKNIGGNIVKIFKSIGKAFKETFRSKDGNGIIYNLIARFHKLTERLKMSDETADKLKRTFKGLFSVISIVGNVIASAVKHVAKGVSSLFESFTPTGSNKSILDFTANLGDRLSELKVKLVDEGGIDKAFDKVGVAIRTAADAIKNFIDRIKDLTPIQNLSKALKNIKFKDIGTNIKNLVKKFTELTKINNIVEKIKELKIGELGKNLIEGFVQGIEENGHLLPELLVKIGTSILDAIKSVLGIHSPSVEMYKIGENTVQGLVNGISDNSGSAKEAIINVGKKIISVFKDLFKNVNWRQIMAAGIVIGLMYTGNKIIKVLDKFAAPFEGVGAVLKSTAGVVGKFGALLDQFKLSLDKFVKAKAFNTRMGGILKFVKAIAIVAVLIIALAQFDQRQLWTGYAVLAAAVGLIVGATILMNQFASSSAKFEKGKGFKISGLQSEIIAIGIVALILAGVIKKIGKLDSSQAQQGFAGLGLIVLSIIILTTAMGSLSKRVSIKDIAVFGDLMLTLSASLILMAIAIKLISTIDDPAAMKKAIVFIGLFTAFVIAIAKLGTSKEERKIAKIGKTLLAISVAMLLMVVVMKAVSKLKPEEILKGIIFMGVFLIFVGILSKVTQQGNTKKTAKLGALLLSITISMLLMVAVMKLVNKLSVEEVLKGVAFMLLFVVFVGLINVVSRISNGKKIARLSTNLLAMTIAVGVLAAICVLLGFVDTQQLKKGIIAVGFLALFVSGMTLAAGTMKDTKHVTRSLIAMTVCIALLAAAVIALGWLETKNLATATAALDSVMGMMILMMLATGKMGASKGQLAGIALMAGIIATIGVVLNTLAQLPWQQSLAAAAGVLMVMVAVAVMMVALQHTGKIGVNALASVGLMVGVIAAIAGILYLLRDMNPETAIGNAVALSTLLLSLTACTAILSLVGTTGAAAFVGIGALAVLIGAVAGIIVALGALNDNVPKMKQFMEDGIPVLTTIGEAIGSFFGGIVAGFTTEATSGLAEVGENIANFANKLSEVSGDAVTGAKNVAEIMLLITAAEFIDSLPILGNLFGDSSTSDWSTKLSEFGGAVKAFSDSVVGINVGAVTAASMAGQILVGLNKSLPRTGGRLQEFLGEQNLETFGERLKAFGESMVGFSQTVSAEGAINSSAVESAANAGKILVELNNELPETGGKLQEFLGEQNLETFGERLKAFGESIVAFSQTVSAEGAINSSAVESAANAGQILADLNNNLPATGGKLQQWFLGEQNLESFGEQLSAFGTAIVDFSSVVSSDGAINIEAINNAAQAGAALADLSASLPEEGFFDAKLSIDDFGGQLKQYGEGLSDFSSSISSLETENMDAAIKMGKSLVTLSQSAIDMDMSGIENFGNVKDIGSAMKKYSDEITGLNIDEVSTSTTSARTLLNLVKNLIGVDYTGMSYFSNITSIGTTMSNYSRAVTGISIEDINSSITAANRLLSFINNTANMDASGTSSFVSAVSTLSSTNFSGFVSAFESQTTSLKSIGSKMADALGSGFKGKQSSLSGIATSTLTAMVNGLKKGDNRFKSIGQSLMNKLVSGLRAKKSDVKKALSDAITSSISNARSYYSPYYSAGSYLVTGFAKGISNNTSQATRAAKKMAKAAYAAAKKELDINSPSKVFRRLGTSIPEGMAQGIDRFSKVSTESAREMAKSAINGAQNTLVGLANLIDNGVSNEPTITPVLDLSNVQSGMGTLGAMLNSNNSFGLSANLNAIDSSRRSKIQNATNDDVVYAINKLRGDIGNINNNSYTINGVTYDDGSNISNAVEAIVRAARIDRRS